MDWVKVKEIPSKLFTRFDRMYFINANSFLILAFLGMRNLYFNNRKHFQIGIILFLASISWAFIMPQHIFIHYFTIRHWGLFFAFIIGTGIFSYLSQIKSTFFSSLLQSFGSGSARIQEVKKPIKYTVSLREYRTGNLKVRIILVYIVFSNF